MSSRARKYAWSASYIDLRDLGSVCLGACLQRPALVVSVLPDKCPVHLFTPLCTSCLLLFLQNSPGLILILSPCQPLPILQFPIDCILVCVNSTSVPRYERRFLEQGHSGLDLPQETSIPPWHFQISQGDSTSSSRSWSRTQITTLCKGPSYSATAKRRSNQSVTQRGCTVRRGIS
jgi:hypothetical protein